MRQRIEFKETLRASPEEKKTFRNDEESANWGSTVSESTVSTQAWPYFALKEWMMKSSGWEDNRRALLQYILTCKQ